MEGAKYDDALPSSQHAYALPSKQQLYALASMQHADALSTAHRHYVWTSFRKTRTWQDVPRV